MKLTFNKIAQIFSYKVILSAIIIFFTIVPSLTAFFSIKKYVDNVIMNEYVADYMDAVETKLSENVSNLIYRINTMSLFFTTKHSLYTTLLNDKNDYDTTYNELNSYIQKYIEGNTFIEGISIITHDNTVYNFSSIKPFDDLYNGKLVNEIGNSSLWVSDYCKKSNDSYYLIAGKKMYNYYNGYDAGYLIMYIDESVFFNMYENYTFDDSTFFITRNGNIISHSDKQLIGSNNIFLNYFMSDSNRTVKINDNCIISKRPINTNGIINNLEIVSVNSFDNFNTMLKSLNKKFIILLIAVIFLSIILALIISTKLLSEIEILRKNILNFGISPTDYKPVFKLNEIKALENDFKNMTRRINRLINNISEEKEKQKAAELSALQAQINPHFIYNTLDSIAWMTLMNGNNEVYNLICSLANFFRISLTSGRRTITVKEEIEHVKNYINIETVRFPDKFTVTYDIDKNILDIEIVKIILQPLVENSIKHGFDNMKSGGKIHISGYPLNNEEIQFEITDNGCGMDFNPLSNSVKSERHSTGYGIKNINQRLILAYGANYGLTFKSKKGEGTTVYVTITTSFKT